MSWIAYRDKQTGKIAAIYENCDTTSPLYTNTMLYVREDYGETKPEYDGKTGTFVVKTFNDKVEEVVLKMKTEGKI